MLALAVPVILAELGWVTMSIVDTMMVGRIGANSIGAVSLGSGLFIAVAIFGIGNLLGLDTLISQAFGGEKHEECHRWLLHGVYLASLQTIPLTAVLLASTWVLGSWGIDAGVLEQTIPYLETITWSLFPLLLYTSFRRYLQSISLVRPVMFALVTANLVNVTANWILIFGNLGLPALGVVGAGWATFLSRVYMAAVLLFAIFHHERRCSSGLFRTPLYMEWKRLARLLKLGLPAAVQLTLEVGVFAAATALAGKLDAASLAAHQIALSAASFSFMIPLGISSAGAVRVGQALGRRSPAGAEAAGWTALLISGIFMTAAMLSFLLFPYPILRIFTPDQSLIRTATSLLFVAAFFQLFDGFQVVSTGILRGLGDTSTPMVSNLIGHWFIGLPAGYALCFLANQGVIGLWIGLSIGLTLVGAVLLLVWSLHVRRLKGKALPSF